MPVGEGKIEALKKRPSKKGRSKHKTKAKAEVTNGDRTRNVRQDHLQQLTAANLSSLRWDDALADPSLESDRVERYKELRRQRYIDAQQQMIEKLLEKTKITTAEK